jgi:hypothetical protein
MPCYIDGRRARRRARGAAMLEALIVVIFLVGVLISLVFVAAMYQMKLRSMHEARGRNMLNATNDCKAEGSSLGSPMHAPEDGQSQGLEDTVRSMIDVQRFIVEGGGLSRVEVRQQLRFGSSAPRTAEGRSPLSGSVSWRSTTACNPAVVGLNPLDLLAKLGIKDELGSVMAEGM